jgi:chromosomal replication initiation ATPase DnaA
MSLTFVNDNSGIPIAKITSKTKELDNKILYFNDKGKVNNNSLVPTYNELKLKDDNDRFHLMPSDKTRSIFISGMQGIGKSYWIGAYLKQYQKLHKDCKIIIFSEKDYDSAIDDDLKKITRIPCDRSLLENPITKDEFNDQPEYTMFVFDDVDGLEIKVKKKCIDY